MSANPYEKILDRIVSEIIKERKKRDISHEKLAKMSGISRSAISFVENRKSTPTIITCMKICDALEIRLSEILQKVDK